MIYCENCHAPVAEESAKCPYCGALNAVDGEKQYMEQIYAAAYYYEAAMLYNAHQKAGNVRQAGGKY
ncbi:MAG: hypothetical protein K2K90_12280 [Lachnospiraceae bacterium]|nr:hypothetical protein [Lachnospiraceae bacterium]